MYVEKSINLPAFIWEEYQTKSRVSSYSRDAFFPLSIRNTYSILARLAKKGLGQQADACFTYFIPVVRREKKLMYSLQINKIAIDTPSELYSKILTDWLDKPILAKNN